GHARGARTVSAPPLVLAFPAATIPVVVHIQLNPPPLVLTFPAIHHAIDEPQHKAPSSPPHGMATPTHLELLVDVSIPPIIDDIVLPYSLCIPLPDNTMRLFLPPMP
ncbi:hypothetical protein U1Q18_027798, partial [Sarracenia purpurea var. burkii]